MTWGAKMPNKVYYSSPYLKEIKTTVKEVRPDGLVLEDAITYPESGGQPGDRGKINGRAFSDTQKAGDDILCLMDDASLFHVGDEATVSIDWPYRYFHMKEHAAQHMISGILFRSFGLGTLAVHQGEEVLTVETDRKEIDDSVLIEVERLVNKAINENHAITYREMSHADAEALGLRRSIKVAGDVRIVDIEGVDVIACGGIHVATTGEIGSVEYISKEEIRGHVRTIWMCAERAEEHRHLMKGVTDTLSSMLSSPLPSLADSAGKVLAENKDLKARVRKLESMVAENEYKAHVVDGKAVFEASLPLRSYQDALGVDSFLVHEEDGKLTWMLRSSESAFLEFKKHFSEMGMKGGGRVPLYQGSASEERKGEIMALACEIFYE